MRFFLKAALVIAPLALATAANAQIVNVNAATSGCVNSAFCDGSPHWPAGTIIGDLLAPTQLILGPGTYSITNATGMVGANPDYTAWRFNGGDNWVWAFMMINDADKSLIVQGCCGAAVYSTQAAAAADPFPVNYFTTFTLATTTTLDFITEDYFPGDNAGGVSLDIQAAKTTVSTDAAPEPETWALMLPGLVLIGGVAQRKRAAKK
jgi:hypothetical protein